MYFGHVRTCSQRYKLFECQNKKNRVDLYLGTSLITIINSQPFATAI